MTGEFAAAWLPVIFVPIILAYTAWVFKVLFGRLTTEEANAPGTY